MASSILIEYILFLNRSIWPIDGTLICTTTQAQSGSGSNGNEEVLHTLQITSLVPYWEYIFWGGSVCLKGIHSAYS